MRYSFISLVVATILLASCSSLTNPRVGKTYQTKDSLQITFYHLGDGLQADSGDIVSMHYIGKLSNDSVFGTSYQRNQPFIFRLGNNEVIRGWEIAVETMQEGDSALLVIPPDLAYGEKARGSIPANSTLKFMVKLLDVKKMPKPYDTTDAVVIRKENGLTIYKVKQGDGQKLQEGLFVKIHYAGYFEDGKLFDSSREREQPITLQIGKNQVIPGWEQALKEMSVGDKARVVIPPKLAYGEQGNQVIEPNATLIMDIEILEANEPEKAEPFDVQGKDTTYTESGLGIIKVQNTDGPMASSGNIVTVHYTGYLENGEVFDSSIEAGKPISFELGKGQVIKGWDEGLQMMRKGEKARLVIPYQLAYGESGAGPIPPKAQLIFDVHLVDIE